MAEAGLPPKRIAALLFLLALIPRSLSLQAYVAPDEAKWILRSAHFLASLLQGRFFEATSAAATPEVPVLAPAVTTMWSGTIGLLAKYWAEGADRQQSLLDYLTGLPQATERMDLSFFPWARFPTVILASAFVVALYLLGRELLGPGPALLGGVLLALDPFFMANSRVIHHDALVTIFSTLSILCLLVYTHGDKKSRHLFYSGLAAGLAVLTKPTAAYLFPFAVLLLAWTRRDARRWGRDLALWGAFAALIVFALWPALWTDPLRVLEEAVGTSLPAITPEESRGLIWPEKVPDLGILYYPVCLLLRLSPLALLGLLALPLRGTGEKKPVVGWLLTYSLLFIALITIPATQADRYALPVFPILALLAGLGLHNLRPRGRLLPVLVVAVQALSCLPYHPYYVNYYNPLVGGPWLAPRLVKVGGGEGMDQAARHLNGKAGIEQMTVATGMWESFVPFFHGKYTKYHYDEHADYVINYVRQIQNGAPYPEYWQYFQARPPEKVIRLAGIDYAYIYAGPSPFPVRDASFGDVSLVGYLPAEGSSRPLPLTLIWRGAKRGDERQALVRLAGEAGQTWAQGKGPLLTPEGPSAVEGHYWLDLPPELPPGDYRLLVEVLDRGQSLGQTEITNVKIQ